MKLNEITDVKPIEEIAPASFMQGQRMVIPDNIKTMQANQPVPKDVISQAFMAGTQATTQRRAQQGAAGGAPRAGAGGAGAVGGFAQFVATLTPQQKQALKGLL